MASMASSAATVTSDYFTQLGDIFGTTQSTSCLQEKSDSFNAAWQSYETDTSSSASEALVLSSAQALTETVTETAQQLQDLGTQATKSGGELVDDLNSKLQTLAQLNHVKRPRPCSCRAVRRGTRCPPSRRCATNGLDHPVDRCRW